jgi:2-polyprenyl-3-methyl-5-hydroxy-6-metoxy-1,4-benzoquinol methylase
VRGDDAEEQAGRLAAESLAEGDPTGWFERLYVASSTGGVPVPWDREEPHPLLVDWAEGRAFVGGRALVVGSGLGEDAEFVAGLGFATTAFDISATAVGGARARFADTSVDYRVADLLDPPDEWAGAFDFVLESYTVQALPEALRGTATARVASFVAPGGTLLVIAAARYEGAHADGPPWPLTPAQVEAFAAGDLEPVRIERDQERWRAEFRR